MVGPLRPAGRLEDIITDFQTADPAFLGKTVKNIVQMHDWRHISGWPFWPPGMVALETCLYWLSPLAPLAGMLVILTCAVWACVLWQMSGILIGWGCRPYIARLLPVFLLLLNAFAYLLRAGVFYSESLSIAFFLLGAGFLLRAATGGHCMKRACMGGVMLALSAYMRAQTDIIMEGIA